jgi:tyrosyl-tRNA synthetase
VEATPIFMEETLEILDIITLFSDCYDISKAEARRLLKGGGLYINNIKATENRFIEKSDLLFEKYILLRIGKSNYLILIFSFA